MKKETLFPTDQFFFGGGGGGGGGGHVTVNTHIGGGDCL